VNDTKESLQKEVMQGELRIKMIKSSNFCHL